MIYWASSPSGALPLAILLAQLFAWNASLQGAHGVGLRPKWEPTRGDAHARESLKRMLILTPTAISGVPLLTWLLVLAAVLWVVVAVVTVANRRQLSRPPLRRRLA
jgi:hypothetical protein